MNTKRQASDPNSLDAASQSPLQFTIEVSGFDEMGELFSECRLTVLSLPHEIKHLSLLSALVGAPPQDR